MKPRKRSRHRSNWHMIQVVEDGVVVNEYILTDTGQLREGQIQRQQRRILNPRETQSPAKKQNMNLRHAVLLLDPPALPPPKPPDITVDPPGPSPGEYAARPPGVMIGEYSSRPPDIGAGETAPTVDVSPSKTAPEVGCISTMELTYEESGSAFKSHNGIDLTLESQYSDFFSCDLDAQVVDFIDPALCDIDEM